MWRKVLLLSAPLLAALFFTACQESTTPTGPQKIVIPGNNEPVLYRTHIEPIWLNSCSGAPCHVGGGKSAGLSLDSFEKLVDGSNFGAVIIPFSAERSHLFQHINPDIKNGPRATPSMPLSRNALPTEQVLLIKRWLNEGATGPNGQIPLAGDNRSRLLITCQSEDIVAVLDVATEKISRFAPVGILPDDSSPPEAPHNIIVAPDGGSFYVVLIATGRVERYSTSTYKLLGSANVGASPSQLRFSPDGKSLFVSNFDATTNEPFVYRIDPNLSTTPVAIDIEGNAPHGITFGLQGRYLYTMNAFSDDISVVDLSMSTPEVVARIPLVPGSPPAPAGGAKIEPYQSEIAPDGTMYVTCRKSGEVRLVDLTARKVIDSIPVGKRPLIPALSPNGSELWVPNQSSNSISIISTTSRTVVGTISGLDAGPHAVLFRPDGLRAWVSCENLTGSENLHHPLEGTEVVPGLLYRVDVPSKKVVGVTELAGFAAGLDLIR